MHGSPPNLEGVFSTELRVLATKFEGTRGSVSRGLVWDVVDWTSSVSIVCVTEQEVISCQKKTPNLESVCST